MSVSAEATMARLFSAGCMLAVFCLATAQLTGDLDSLIAQVFPGPGGNTSTNNPAPAGQGGGINLTDDTGAVAGTGDCSCVPYYLCNNNTIIKDGIGIIDIRIKEGPCENYFEICCGNDNVVEKPIPTMPIQARPEGCGWRNPEGARFRITGASDGEAQFGEFPWMVAVLREEPVEGSSNKSIMYQCGGSLIHPKAVLTAAHCVTGKHLGKKFKIRAGEWDTQTMNEIIPHQDRDVETIITHEHFRSGTLYNDVALLILKDPVEIAGNVDVVCLPPSNQVIDSSKCFATGWGKNVFGKEGKYQVVLKKVELPMVVHSQCQNLLRKTRLGVHFELHRTFVCAGGEPGKDTCKGDGGSPLVCPVPGVEGRYQQAGIVAWGIGCGEQGTPGVYVNIAALRNWIDEQMAYQRLDMAAYKY